MAAGPTYEPIATNTLSTTTASVTFSSISGSYTDLVLLVSAQQVTQGENFTIRFNGDTGSNYSRTYFCGDGSTAHSNRSTSVTGIVPEHHGTMPPSVSFCAYIINIQNYSNSTTYKTVLSRANADGTIAGTAASVGLWRNTAAITSITFFGSNSSSFLSGSTFTLYGIAAA